MTPREQWAQEFGRRTALVAIAELRTQWTEIRLSDEATEEAELADEQAWHLYVEAGGDPDDSLRRENP